MNTTEDTKQALRDFHEATEDGFFYGHAKELIDKLYEMHDMEPHPIPDMTGECE